MAKLGILIKHICCLSLIVVLLLSLTLILPSITVSAQSTICEGNTDSVFDNYGCGQTNLIAQQFTPESSHAVTYIELMLSRTGSSSNGLCLPGQVNASITTTDGEGKPTGLILASGDFNGNTLSGDSETVQIVLNKCIMLQAGTMYAIVVSAPDADSVGCLRLWITEDLYPGGQLLESGDSGVSWTPHSHDLYFQLCGPPYCPPPPPSGVGGELYPVDKLGILAPWLGLAVLLAVGGGLVVMRRRQAG